MKNNFDPEELRRWFGDNYRCWWCGRNHYDANHHILGRSGKHKSSLLNCAPMNNFECHVNVHPILNKLENKRFLLQTTLSYLLSKGYVMNETDKMFLYSNAELYRKE